MGKYTTLANFFSKQTVNRLRMTFDDINNLLPKGDPLPISATKHRAWWANGDNSHAHAQSWLAEGYKVIEVNQDEKYVVFERQ